jgi:hypothetical protein
MRLRLEHFIKTKDFHEFLLPTKGTLGNPDLSILFSTKGKKVLKILRKLIYTSLFLLFIAFTVAFIWSLVTK